jgi:hypothetical protein
MTYNNDAVFWAFARTIALDGFHCLTIFLPYHYVADGRKYRGYTQHLYSWRNINALDRVRIATDRIRAKKILFVLPQTFPESFHDLQALGTGLGIAQPPSLRRESTYKQGRRK